MFYPEGPWLSVNFSAAGALSEAVNAAPHCWTFRPRWENPFSPSFSPHPWCTSYLILRTLNTYTSQHLIFFSSEYLVWNDIWLLLPFSVFLPQDAKPERSRRGSMARTALGRYTHFIIVEISPPPPRHEIHRYPHNTHN